MEKRVNQGYEIVQSIEVGTSEFVLGVSQYHPEQFVTWKMQWKDGLFLGTLYRQPAESNQRSVREGFGRNRISGTAGAAQRNKKGNTENRTGKVGVKVDTDQP